MDGIYSTRQLDRESSTARRIVGHLDSAAMLVDDTADDGEADAAAALLGRVMRQEQLAPRVRRNPRPVVGDRDPDPVFRRQVLGLDVDAALAAHRLERVV